MAASIPQRLLLPRKYIHQSGIGLLKKHLKDVNGINRSQFAPFLRCLCISGLPHERCTLLAKSSATPVRYCSDTVKKEESKIETTTEDDELYKSIEVRVKGHDEAVLNSYEKFVSMAAKELDITLDSVTKPKKHMKRLSLLKSRFIHKKHFVQYEIRTHYRVMLFKHLTGSTASVFLEYIQRNLPEGVAMKVTKRALEAMPEYIKPPSDADLDQLVTGLDKFKV
ncbi:small ribosomal subunit protein uS10m-like [Antedon mediterranea]|uniref:small ribosomal subunit protein uS10m-like n=1 Tax=Antedon mediterranea TaxID=105859 RepID=UPI003AF50E25